MLYIGFNRNQCERGLQELRNNTWMNISKYSEYIQLFRIYEFRPLSDFGYT